MAKLEIPVVIDGVKSIEELANRVLDDYEFKGKTIREWADRIAHPETNGDRLRSMTDEELAEFLNCHNFCARNFDCEKGKQPCKECNLDWLREEAEK